MGYNDWVNNLRSQNSGMNVSNTGVGYKQWADSLRNQGEAERVKATLVNAADVNGDGVFDSRDLVRNKKIQQAEAMKTADLNALQQEITNLENKFLQYSELKKERDEYYKKISSKRKGLVGSSLAELEAQKDKKYLAYNKELASYGDIEKELTEKKAYKNKAQRIQDSISLASVADPKSQNYDENFKEYAEKGNALSSQKNAWYESGYKNQIGYLRNNPETIKSYESTKNENGAIVDSILSNQLTYLAAKYMTDDEFAVYNYYLAKENEGQAEKGIAERYLKSIQDNLTDRQGRYIAEEKDSTFSKYTYGYNVGTDQFTQGTINRFNTQDDYIPATGIQKASAQIRSDIKEQDGVLGQIGYDMLTTTSNMLPSILTSTAIGFINPTAGAVVGAGLMGTSASGSAYQEMLNLGYDKKQANTYSIFVGASEAALSYAFSGINKLGGKLTDNILKKAIAGIDNGIAKFAIEFGGKIGSEGLEEAAQEVLTPLFENIALGYDKNGFEDINWSEVAYSGLLGMLSSVGISAVEAADSAAKRNYNKDTSFAKQVDDVINGTHNPRYDLYVSETPKVLTDLGFTDSPLLMRNSKVNEILKKHSEMSADTIKKVPEAIQNPILILKSKTHPTQSVVAITDIVTDKGNMIVPVWINQEGNYVDVDLGIDVVTDTNFVASAYGRNVKSLLEYANENDGFLYQSEDIEKVRQLIARNGLQLPTPLKLSDSDITISQNDNDVNNNISTGAGNNSENLQSNANNDNRPALSEPSGSIASFGGIDTVKGKHLDRFQQEELQAIGEKLGRTVNFEDFYELDKFKGKKKIPDGYIDKDGNIHINFYAKRPVYFIFKHEITHYLKRALPAYTDFMDMTFNSKAFSIWLHSRGYSSINELKAEIMDTYSEVKGFDETKCYDEILADFVGARLFGGERAINTELMNTLEPKQKKTFLDVIKDIIAYFKAKFSENAKVNYEINRIEKEFIKVYNEAVKVEDSSNVDSEQYSIVNLDTGKSYVQASRKIITGNSVAEWRKQISNFFNISLKNGPIEIKSVEGDTLTITKETAEKARDRNVTENGVTRKLTDEEFLVKLHAESHIDELAEISIAQKSKKGNKNVVVDTKNHNFAKDGFTYRTVYFQDFGGGYYRISLSIGENNGISTVYNVGKIKADDIPNGNMVSAIGSKADMSSADNMVTQKPPTVKNNSMQETDNYSIPQQTSAESLLEMYENGETHSGENLKDTPDILKPTSSREWSAFNRSFANQTNGLKSGEKKSIIITTSSSAYFVYADGYMSGIIAKKINIDKQLQGDLIYDNIRRTDFDNRIDEILGDRQRNRSSNYVFGNRGTDTRYDDLDAFIEQHPEWFRNKRESYADYTRRIKNQSDTSDESFSVVIKNSIEDYYEGEKIYGSVGATGVPDFRNEKNRNRQRDYNNDSNQPENGETDSFYVELDAFIREHSKQLGNIRQARTNYRGNEISEDSYSIPNYTIDQRAILTELASGEITVEEAENLLSKQKPLNPIEIANLTAEDASTTPYHERRKGKSDGDKTSKFYGSLLESDIFDERFKNEVRTDSFIEKYKSVTNKETLKEAANELDEGGRWYVNKWWSLKPDRASLIDTAVGFILMDRYQRVGDYESAIAAAEKVREFGTAGGQQVQIFSVIGRLDPNTMAVYAQKELTKAFEAMAKGRTKSWIDKNADRFNLTEEETEFIRRKTLQAAQLPEGRDKAIRLAEITTLLQDKLPPQKGQGLRALQRISMLLNIKTNIRNITGNGIMVPVFIVSDFFGSGIDKAVSKKTGMRTTGNFDVKSVKGFKKGVFETMDDFRRHINTRNEELNRFDVGSGKSFNEKGNGLFNTGVLAKQMNDCAKVLNAIDRFTSFCLEMGDRPFFEMWYINSLNNQMKLNKVTEATPEMIAIASAEALQRTWQDSNKVVKAVAGSKEMLNYINIGGYGLGDVLIKFTKTPANLTKAIFDFSPAGMIKAIAADGKALKNAIETGQFEPSMQKKFVDSLSKGIAGTLLYVLAAGLASAGLLSGGSDEDDDVSNFEKYIQGTPEYSFKLFGKWYSYEWMQPVGAVAAIVTDYMKSTKENPDNEWHENVMEAIRSGGEVLYNQSFMKSIQILFTADSFIDGLIEELINEPSVYVPQLLSQAANATDDYRRVKYEKNKPFKTAINNVKIKIPGLRQTLEKQTDILGRDVPNSQGDFFNAFINPANTFKNTSNAVTDELYHLYKQTGNKTVMPRVAPYDLTVKGNKRVFTTEERRDYQRILGGTSSEILEQAFKEREYKKLSEEEKVKFITKVYDFANNYTKSGFEYDYDTLSAMVGEKKNGEPILTKSVYSKLSDNDLEELAQEYFLSKAEMRYMDDYEKLIQYYIRQIEN